VHFVRSCFLIALALLFILGKEVLMTKIELERYKKVLEAKEAELVL